MSFRKILVANRGEIACRVMRTARRLGYRSVAVFSDADATSPHVHLADEAVDIGPSPADQSYLSIEALLGAARRTGADAVHPGYGFLSERADFAQACVDAGLVFIGPPPQAIRWMGDKAQAKRRMIEAGVPCVPGYLGEDQSDARLHSEAARLGFPLLVKAVAGGGGRGMRLVHQAEALQSALDGARREAASAFGDSTLMLERLVERGRHIEVQVFADAQGQVIHLGERDCTAQRRRQKVIEEAPSPIVSEALRARLGHDAVQAAVAVAYVGAGTVEFIVDGELNHYFLEMNTRLQVEHPVTECITGLDLVEWQLRVAEGQPLPLQKSDIRFEGHAIEVRLYAEDSTAGFVPQTGRVLHWRPDALPAGLRVDSGVAEGQEVSPFYDPMLAKLVAHGRNRADALRCLVAALEDSPLLGVRNNGRFLRDLLRHPDFVGARMHTALLDEWQAQGEPLMQAVAVPESLWAVAAAALALQQGPAHRPDSVAAWELDLLCGSESRRLRVRPRGRVVDVRCGDGLETVDILELTDHRLRWQTGGVQRSAVALLQAEGRQPTLHLAFDAAEFTFTERSPYPSSLEAADPNRLRASVAGTVADLRVAVGDTVAFDQPLVCVEAMKMEMWLSARSAGRVVAVHVQAREAVAAGTVLIEIEPEVP